MNFLKEIQEQFSAESLGENVSVQNEDKYENSALAECFYALESLERIDEANKSLKETLRGITCYDNDMAVAKEEGSVVIEKFSVESVTEEKVQEYAEAFSYEGVENKFALEANPLVNKVKRAGYTAKINIKEIIKKFITWIKGIWDAFMVQDGKLKSYKKLIKKYREKLTTTNDNTSSEKEVTIREIDYATLLSDYNTAIPDNLTTETTAAKGATQLWQVLKALADAAIGTIKQNPAMSSISAQIDGLKIPVNSNNNFDTTTFESHIEKINDFVNDKTLIEEIKNYIEDKTDEKSESMKVGKAQGYLIQQAAKVESLIVDKKYKKMFDNFLKAVNKQAEKLNKDKNVDVTEIKINYNGLIVAVGSLLTQYRTGVVGKQTKFVSSQLQALLADMAKVVNANTSIKGN